MYTNSFVSDGWLIIDLWNQLYLSEKGKLYQNVRETWEKKVMKFDHETVLMHSKKKKKTWEGQKKKPPHGIRIK